MSRLHEECSTLNEQSLELERVSEDLSENMKPVSEIEKGLDDTAKLMGQMVEDVFYMLDNRRFITNVQNAVTAPQNWLHTLEKMVRNHQILPLQTDDTKCAFGHFYYAMNPRNKMISPLWIELAEKHRRFHNHGKNAISAIRTQDYDRAETESRQAATLSEELIGDFKKIIANAEALERDHIQVFAE